MKRSEMEEEMVGKSMSNVGNVGKPTPILTHFQRLENKAEALLCSHCSLLPHCNVEKDGLKSAKAIEANRSVMKLLSQLQTSLLYLVL